MNRSSHTGPEGREVDELIVVGAFDTVSKTSQVGVFTTIANNLCPICFGSKHFDDSFSCL